MSRPVVFISYSHKDEKEKDQLLSHLGVVHRAGLIELWSDDRIGVGADWEAEINEAITRARVAILLISANFLTSDFILGKEVPPLLKRREGEGLIVFPVIAKACAWRTVSWLAEMNVRPKNGKPVWSDAGSHADEELAAIAEEVALIVNEGTFDSSMAPASPTRPSATYREAQETSQFKPMLSSLNFQSKDEDMPLTSTVELLTLLNKHFDLEEFRMLCFTLGVDFDNLRGEGKSAKARELVVYMERRGQLDKLVAEIRRHRPGAI